MLPKSTKIMDLAKSLVMLDFFKFRKIITESIIIHNHLSFTDTKFAEYLSQ